MTAQRFIKIEMARYSPSNRTALRSSTKVSLAIVVIHRSPACGGVDGEG